MGKFTLWFNYTARGILIANLSVLVIAFLYGAIYGTKGLTIGVNHSPVQFGIDGGMTALGNVAVVYIFTCGIAPLIVSAIGAGLAQVPWWMAQDQPKQSER